MDICTRNMSAWLVLTLIYYCYKQHVKNSNQQYSYKAANNQILLVYINYQFLCTDYYLFIKYLSPLHVSSHKCSSSGGYSCTRAAYDTVTLYESSWWLVGSQLEWGLASSLKLCTYKPPGTLIESDSIICCTCTTVSSWSWALEARNM